MLLGLYRPMALLARCSVSSISIRSCSSVTAAVNTSSRVAVSSSKSTSLAWVQVHDATPTSYGLRTWSGYEEMIRPGQALPTKERMTLEGSIFHYYDRDTFTVCYRRSPQDQEIEITAVELTNIWIATAKETIIYAVMEIDKTLRGSLSVRDPHTKSAASIVFNAAVTPQQENLVLRNGMSEAAVTTV